MNTQRNIIQIEQIKKISLDGLILFKNICEKNNLTYYLSYGTLIGAVRHKGFIPWDDDIDVIMPRKDFEVLLNLSDQIDSCNWKILSYKKQKDYCYPWIKFSNTETIIKPSRFNTNFEYGISIDIFPLDYIDEVTYEGAKTKINKVRDEYVELLKKTRVIKDLNHSKIVQYMEKLFYCVCGRLFNYNEKLNKIIEKSSIQDQGTKYCTCFFDPYGVVWETQSFFDPDKKSIKLQFENEKFTVPVDYDAVLKKVYSNYMILPPAEKQIIPHTYDAYYKGK